MNTYRFAEMPSNEAVASLTTFLVSARWGMPSLVEALDLRTADAIQRKDVDPERARHVRAQYPPW